MLAHLAPARRRLYLGLATVVAAALVVVLVLVVARARGGDDVTPVVQDRLGPVLLVPGYGGSTASLSTLASALRAQGREVQIVPPVGDGTGDLRDQAAALGQAATGAVDAGAPSVDVVGYSAGGVVARYWVARLGGGSLARRVITLSSPSHGTDLAALAGGVAPDACPVACQQLAPDSDLLRDLNRGDETPPGPQWVALWTTDDATVVPPTSGSLDGALDFSVQSVCPGLHVSHGQMPDTAAVIAMVEAELTTAPPARPGSSVCG